MKHLYFFGCGAHVGHSWFGPNLRPVSQLERKALNRHFGSHIDGTFAPAHPHRDNGNAQLSQTGEWTILAWHDRSVDRRMGSNSALVASGAWSFDQMLSALREHFPGVATRQLAPIAVVVHMEAIAS